MRQINGTSPEVFAGANSMDVGNLSSRHRWWLRHRRNGHRTIYEGEDPVCITCGEIGTLERARVDDERTRYEEVRDGPGLD